MKQKKSKHMHPMAAFTCTNVKVDLSKGLLLLSDRSQKLSGHHTPLSVICQMPQAGHVAAVQCLRTICKQCNR